MVKKALLVLLIFIWLDCCSIGATWYVRPAGGSYGNEDGTAYADAWDGLLNVVWGGAGVVAGDALYVCGLHIYSYTSGSIASVANITLVSGTNDSTRVTIRGDYSGDAGIVWGAYGMSHEAWADEGNNVWSITLPANSFSDWFFEDIGDPTDTDFTLLDKEASQAACQANPGSHYSATYESTTKLFVQCSDSGNPTGRIYANRFGYRWIFDGLEYITFLNLTLCAKYYYLKSTHTADYITWDGCTMAYGEHSILAFRDGCDYMKVMDCELSWASNGIYNISSGNSAPHSYTFSGNYIHDIGVRAVNQNLDAHSIGVQGGYDGLIEDNITDNCGTGPLLYAETDQEVKTTIVRKNLVRNLHTLGGANAYGIGTACDNDSTSDKSGNEFYHNIIIGAEAGMLCQFEDEVEVYNNVFYDCDQGIRSGRNYNGLGANVKLRNNIFLDSGTYHINWFGGATEGNYIIDSDYNLFHPVAGDLFRKIAVEMTLAEWQALSATGCTFDTPNSISGDPLFVNEGGENFELLSGSPARDSGIDVGLTTDFDGTAMPQNVLFDIGVEEYLITGVKYLTF